ncbi:anks1b, partial [Symbiodinium sp. CCMP2592]
MVADGDCLFHALAHGHKRTMEDENGARPLPADLGQALRRDVTSFLTAHAFEQGDFAESWLEEAERLDRGSEEAWAGNDSIVAFSLMKRCRVHVHTYLPDGSIVAIDSTHRDLQNLADLPTVHVFYNGQDHYDALVQAEDVALLVPAWKGQTWPMRYWRLPGELPPLESGDALPPIKKTRSAESVLAPEAPDPAEDILDEVCKAIVAPASTHPHRQMEDAITKLGGKKMTGEEFLQGSTELREQLQRGKYVDITGAQKSVQGDFSKVQHVPGLSAAAKKIAQ